MEVYLIRHTTVLAPGLCYGHTDVPLADTFATEVARLRPRLPQPPYRVVSSPAQRCVTLAQAIAPELPLAVDERLREMNFGTWENRPWTEIPPAETTPWMADYVTLAPPAGETFGAVQQRAAAVLTELAVAPSEEPTLIFSHGGTIRALVCHCLEIPLRNAFQLQIDYASVARLRLQHGRWQLLALTSNH